MALHKLHSSQALDFYSEGVWNSDRPSTTHMTHLHRNSFPLPAFPLTSLLSDTSSSFGSASSPYASTPSSTQSIDLTLSFIGHPPPSNPSTHLPSYYPEARHRDTLPSQRSPGAAESSSRPGISADRTRSAAIDPYGIHLLDGVAISPPRPPRSVVSPTYDLTPGASSGEKGASSSRPPEFVSLHRNPSATSPRTKQQQPIEQQQQPADGFPSSSSPMQRPASPRSRPSQSGLPPPPMQSSMGAIHDVTTLPEPIPNSASYPGMLFDGLPLTTTDGLLHAPSWGITGPEAKVSGEDYAQVRLSLTFLPDFSD